MFKAVLTDKSQRMETTQYSSMDKENVTQSYNRVLFSYKKK